MPYLSLVNTIDDIVSIVDNLHDCGLCKDWTRNEISMC